MNSPSRYSWPNSEFSDLSQKSAIISEKTSGQARSMDAVYHRILMQLSRLSPSDRQVTRHIFMWMTYSFIHLRLTDLGTAYLFDWKAYRTAQPREELLDDFLLVCRNLIIVDEKGFVQIRPGLYSQAIQRCVHQRNRALSFLLCEGGPSPCRNWVDLPHVHGRKHVYDFGTLSNGEYDEVSDPIGRVHLLYQCESFSMIY